MQQTCDICLSNQHTTAECNYQQLPKCYICGSESHIITDCQLEKQCKFCGRIHENGYQCNNIYKFAQNYEKICYRCGGNHFPFLCTKNEQYFRQTQISMCPFCGRNHPVFQCPQHVGYQTLYYNRSERQRIQKALNNKK